MDEEERRALAERIGARFPDALAGVDEVTSRAAIEAAGGDVDAEPVEREDYGDNLDDAIDVGDPLAGPLADLGAAPAPSPVPAAAPVAQTPTAAPVRQREVAPVATPATPDVRNSERHAVDLGAIARNPESAAGVESRQLNAADEEASRERRRARRLGIAGAVLSGIGLTPYGAIVGGAARMVGDDGRRKAADLRSQIAARAEAQQKQQEEDRRALLAQIEARQGQANRDRDFELRQAALAARGEEFAAQQGLRTRSQDFREQQAELDRTAAERRARIISGQRVGSGGGGGGDGTPTRPGGDVEVGGDVANSDALVIMSIIDTRGAQLAPAVEAEVQRLRSQGVETTHEAVEWQMAADLFNRLPRKERNRIRSTYAMPQTTTSAVTGADREVRSFGDLVRRYGQDRREMIQWDRSVDGARRALAGASDADISMAQQWMQGGAARQSIADSMSPRAAAIGQAVSALQNVLLKERSGAAVTDTELARLNNELGVNWWSSPGAMRAAINRMHESSAAIGDAMAAEYDPEIVERYEENLRNRQGRGGGSGGGGGQWNPLGRRGQGDQMEIKWRNSQTGAIEWKLRSEGRPR